MTDLTDQDRRVAHEWAASIDPDMKCWSDRERVAARVILATVDAPGPTLAEELREFAKWVKNPIWCEIKAKVESMADRAEQIEQERDEARAEVVRGREIIRKHKERADRIAGERDEALAIIETADWRHWFRDNQNLIAEVERLTDENEKLRRTDNYKEFWDKHLTAQKGAESDAESLDPADVKPGEAWLVECRGERRNALKDNTFDIQWTTVNADGWPVVEGSEDITLVSRLVPELHADTTPHHPEGTATQ